MKVLRRGLDPEVFFESLAGASSRVLMVDYDGTLAPFTEERDKAAPYPEARDALADILRLGDTRVVVISGRAIANLRPLLGLDPTPELWGTHGWERRYPDGTLRAPMLGPGVLEALDTGKALASEFVPLERVEAKPASIAVHTRGLDPAEAEDLLKVVRESWSPLTAAGKLDIHDFDGGCELRATGRNKGTAVREILSEVPADTVAAYLGDDFTDEDAFEAISGSGLAVLVRGDLRATSADLWVRPPAELIVFLRRWHLEERRPV